MKKYLIALLLCLNFVSIASAEVAEELIALGNVYPGQPFSEVVKMYGQPYESQPYTFGKMYHFCLLCGENNRIFRIIGLVLKKFRTFVGYFAP